MRVFFDNNTAPTLAATINGFLQHSGGMARHIMDMPCGRHATDLEWIEMLRRDEHDWLVITGDIRIQRNPPERRAFRQAHLRGFVLQPAYQKTPMHQVTSFLLWRWPEIEQLAKLTDAPFLFEVPMNRKSRLRSLPL